MEKILFSGIGNTDPFQGDFDGSMLHIVRHYKPIKVYLYFTKEMYFYDNKVNDCKESIWAIDKNIEIIILPKKEEMIVEAHYPDIYIKPFKKILHKIIKKNRGKEILLNISSGTPSMKNTMLLLSLFNNEINDEVELKTLQVSSPNKGSNFGHRKKEKINDITYHVQNELIDNLEEAPIRITIDNHKQLKINFIANQMIVMLKGYQYVGAYLLIKENKKLFNKDIYLLISHLKNRSTFNIEKADNDLKQLGLTNFIIHNRSLKRVVEYFNIIKINEYNQSYHDTLIMISALTELLFKGIIENLLNIDFQRILTDKKIDIRKVKKHYPKIEVVFNKETQNVFHLKHYHLTTIINLNSQLLSKPHFSLLKVFEEIKEDRDYLAHEVDIYAFNKINHSLIKKALKIINANINDLYKDEYKNEFKNIYDDLNKILIEKLWD